MTFIDLEVQIDEIQLDSLTIVAACYMQDFWHWSIFSARQWLSAYIALSSNRQHSDTDDCLEDKREDY